MAGHHALPDGRPILRLRRLRAGGTASLAGDADRPTHHDRGTVRDGACQPVPDALIEIWQANAAGQLAHPRGSGRRARGTPAFEGLAGAQPIDEGRFAFERSCPAGSPSTRASRRSSGRPCRLRTCWSVSWREACMTRLVTRIYFEDQPSNDDDPVLRLVPPHRRATLIARRVAAIATSSTSSCKARTKRCSSMSDAFSARARLQAMLDVEAALAEAEASLGIIPASAAPGDPRRGARRALRHGRHRGRRPTGRKPRDPAGNTAHQPGRQPGRREPPATCTGVRPARTSSTRRSCCSFARRFPRSSRALQRAGVPRRSTRVATPRRRWPDARGCSRPRRRPSGSRRPAGWRR